MATQREIEIEMGYVMHELAALGEEITTAAEGAEATRLKARQHSLRLRERQLRDWRSGLAGDR